MEGRAGLPVDDQGFPARDEATAVAHVARVDGLVLAHAAHPQPAAAADRGTHPALARLGGACPEPIAQRPDLSVHSVHSVRHRRRCTAMPSGEHLSQVLLKPSLAVLQHLDSLFNSISTEPLPQTFSPDPLLHQLYLLAESEHFKVAASALIFLYNHVDALGDTSRIEVLSWLLQRFTRFSLHWSRVVRTIFFHLAVIKVAKKSHSLRAPCSHAARCVCLGAPDMSGRPPPADLA